MIKLLKQTSHGGEIVANIKSAKKRVLVNETKRANNLPKKSVMKSSVKKAVVNPSEDAAKEDRKSTRLNSSHPTTSRMPSSA